MISSGYIPGKSLCHRLDPRVKIIVLLEICVFLFWPLHIVWYWMVVLVIMVSIAAAAGIRELLTPLKAIVPLLVLVGILTPLFYRGGDVLYSFGIVNITSGGIRETLLLISRFTGITLAFYLFFRTTDLQQFILTLRWYGLPYTAALVITLAFRYIPSIARLLQNVKDAHRLRDPASLPESRKRRKLSSRMRDLQPILTSVVIASIKTIPALAMSLEHRGIGSPRKRSSFASLPGIRYRIHHFAAAVLTAAVLSIPIWMQ